MTNISKEQDEFIDQFNNWLDGPDYQETIYAMNQADVSYENWNDVEVYKWYLENLKEAL